MEWNWEKIYESLYARAVNYGPRIFVAIIILLAGIWLIKIFNKWLNRSLEHRKFNPSLRYFFQNLVAVTLQIFLVMLVLQTAGIKLTFFSAIVAGLTVAVGLALSGTLQNFVSGVLILFLRPYSVGDNISIQGNEGTVSSIQLFFTTVVTFDNKTIIIPNGQLLNNIVINLSHQGKRRLDIELKFNYGYDIAAVKKILQNSVQNSEHITGDIPCRIGVSGLEYERYAITVNVWINAHNYYDTRLLLQEKIINDLKTAGIKLPGVA